MTRGDLGERDQLVGVRIVAGRIDERRGDADGAILHRLLDQLSHLLQLLGRRVHVLVAEDDAAHLRGADVVHDVEREAVPLQQREVLGERAPADRLAPERRRVALRPLVLRRVTPSLAAHRRRDPLAQAALRGDAVRDEHGRALVHQVDESGGDDAILGDDGAAGRASVERSDLGDAAAANADVRAVPWRAGAVHHARIGDQDVERLLRCGTSVRANG